MQRSRIPAVMGDAAYHILKRDSKSCTGNFFIDEEVLIGEGITDLTGYAVNPEMELAPDFFV